MKNKALAMAIDITLILIGTFLMGLAYNVFLVPNMISPSGFAGLSSLVTYLIETNFGFYLSPAILYIGINIILFIFAVKYIGKRFAITSAVGVLGYSLFMEVLKIEPFVTEDLLLCAIFGGLILGLGLGLVLRGRGSTGGSDMLACIINKHFSSISLGTIVMAIDCVVIVASMLVYGLNFSLYSLIAIFVMGKVSDVVVAGVQSVRAFYIVSEKNDEIAKEILNKLPRGVTALKTQGMYTKNESTTLMCLVTNPQVPLLKQIVSSIDLNAFMFSTNVSEAMGKGFNSLKKPKSKIINKIEEIEIEEENIVENEELNREKVENLEKIEEKDQKPKKSRAKKKEKIG